MATEEHKQFANVIKDVHESLRKRSKIIGADEAWKEHLLNKDRLAEYANAMKSLASIWEDNCIRDNDTVAQKVYAHSRIKWIIEYINAYFFTERIYLEKRLREQRLLESWTESNTDQQTYLTEVPGVIRVLDVGSCFNPFKHVPHFDVIALDLCPARESDVLKGDFLKITVVDENDFHTIEKRQDVELLKLPREYFECITFSLLLEYIPSSEQRLMCCRKAYELLRPEGILIIITPDSQHVGKNAALMKTWRYALSTIGFVRIRFEKLPHIACMVFRKPINATLAYRWAKTHCEDYMDVAIEIPQDTKW